MEKKLIELINKENNRNPYTDSELSKLLNVRRELVTLSRQKLGIPDSRERRKRVLLKTIDEILHMDKNISERELTKEVNKRGFDISRHTIRQSRKELKDYKKNQLNMVNNDLEETIEKIRLEPSNKFSFKNIIGAQGSLKPFIQLAKAAMLYPPHGLHTLILGATGVGKSELAIAMYEFSKLSNMIKDNAPFIVFNCADYADNPQLLMAQLFGYVKGAFTGADIDKEGLVEKADGSLLFLDEVHRLPPKGQELLFYLIDKGKFRRLGETEIERKVQVTILAATTENPDSILLNTFRRRIPMTIQLPPLDKRPLKERLEIIKEFIRKEASRTHSAIKICKDALKAFLLYDCPGNIGQLRSDIQVSCARSFLNHVVNKSKIMRITINELPSDTKKGLLKIKNNRIEIQRLTIDSNIIIHPDNKPDKIVGNEGIYIFPNEIYKYIEDRYNDLQNQDMNQEIINYIIGNEIEEKLEKLIKKVEDNIRPIEKKDLIKIVGIEVINAVEKIIKIAKWKLGIDAGKLYYVLAVHLSTTIERISKGKMIRNPQLSKIKKEYEHEFKIALEMTEVLEEELDIQLSEDEAGFITMYLRMMTKEKEAEIEGRVGVVIISHGKVANGMADVANRLLGVAHAKSIEMSLDESPEIALERSIDIVKNVDEGKGVLLLVDMGSLITFGEIITQKTGIRTRSLNRTDTVMVIEAVRRSILPDADLDEIADTLEEKTKYISRLTNSNKKIENRSFKKRKAIITVCITGQGSAQKIKELLENVTSEYEDSIRIIPIGVLESNMKNIVLNIQSKNHVVAIVGTVNPNMNNIPFISLEDIAKGNGVNRLKNLIENDDIKTIDIKKDRYEYRLLDLIHSSLTILNGNFKYKEEVIFELSKLLIENKYVKEGFIYSVLTREEMAPTFLTEGVVIPHANPSYVLKPGIALGKLKREIYWDGKRIKFVMMLALTSQCMKAMGEIYDFFQDRNNFMNIIEQNRFEGIRNVLLTYKGGN
ncbi:sigma 54-interacting transcriptional regulator [Maledivibacter halophilus]|uniref:Sigma 54 modulation protein n=1 Tax=Maledivibacter halophilus TaxID=36842 RepID=A0A1T5MI68_9FIRM|nr:sigma 54-interacting transcriptional regulator [Maledivibacter halophilus]SKC87927.1 sigma 54 modulation protein [Maledivibacter halophilus]